MNFNHQYWMRKALEEAKKGAQENEVPVGAIIVLQNKIIGKSYNKPIKKCDPTAHAEILAIRQAAKYLNNYRLIDCELYVTLEPCTMCAGAIIHSRIKRLIFGTYEPKSGSIKSNQNLFNLKYFNHKIDVTAGILRSECSQLLLDFFKNKRSLPRN